MKKFENLLPRYMIMLVKEGEDTFTSYLRFQNSRDLFESFREEFAALDRECTSRLTAAVKILGIRLLDHVIFGETDYFSFADAGLFTDMEGN